MPALVAICTVFATVRHAAAEEARRQVAVIDLSEDAAVQTLSAGIYKALNQSDVLRNPDQRQYDTYLTGPLFDEDKGRIDAAQRERQEAETALFAAFDAKAAVAAALDGEAELQYAVPTAETRALNARLTLLRGLALLDQHDAAGAARAFALTRRLDPSAQLDPARYPPDITAAFQRAVAAPAAMVALTVHGTGRVWIDGTERGDARGDAPFETQIEAGDHAIVLTGPERETSGVALRVQGAAEVAIPDAPASPELEVKRARVALSRAQAKGDDAARAGAMKRLASLIGVGDALMISKRPDGRLQYETWKDRAPGFSRPKVYVDQPPDDLLVGLAPPRKPAEPVEPPVVISVERPIVAVEQKSWYRYRWVQVSAATGLAAAIVAAILYARRDQTVDIDHDIKGM